MRLQVAEHVVRRGAQRRRTRQGRQPEGRHPPPAPVAGGRLAVGAAGRVDQAQRLAHPGGQQFVVPLSRRVLQQQAEQPAAEV